MIWNKKVLSKIKKGFVCVSEYGIRGVVQKRHTAQYQIRDTDYAIWYKTHCVTEKEFYRQKKCSFVYSPIISIIVPVYHTPIDYLIEMLESVFNQSYGNWELCIANSAPSNRDVSEVLKKYKKKDPRIKVIDIPQNLGIAENTNVALSVASGEYVAFLDHDDVLAKNALYEVIYELNKNEAIDVIYTDEDKIVGDSGKHIQPNFKPDFNLDLLRSNNYICHFLVVRRQLVESVGGLRDKYNGAQDYDLLLRCCEEATSILHIPKVLYHWRIHESSTAENPESKRYAYEAGKQAISEHLKRCDDKGKVTFTNDLGFYRVIYSIQGSPLISIIILNKDNKVSLRKCIRSIRKSRYKNWEILIADCKSEEEKASFQVINHICNKAQGEYLLFISSDIELRGKTCIEELLSNCQRNRVGITGGKICYKNNIIRYAGTIIDREQGPYCAFAGMPRSCVGYMHRDSIQQNLSAVSMELMMVRKAYFKAVKGFNESIEGILNEVDFCQRVAKMGLIVFDPYALAYCSANEREKVSSEKSIDSDEKWSKLFAKGDPAYNLNLGTNFKLDMKE